MKENDTVLNGRYTLTSRVPRPAIEPSELWEATDSDGSYHTLKITPYVGEKPPSEVRRLWDNDLRVMYRLSSSAGAGGQLVVMTDAGIDTSKHAMVLVYEGCEHITFAEMLKDREQHIGIADLRDIFQPADAVHHQSGGNDRHGGVFRTADLNLAV